MAAHHWSALCSTHTCATVLLLSLSLSLGLPIPGECDHVKCFWSVSHLKISTRIFGYSLRQERYSKFNKCSFYLSPPPTGPWCVFCCLLRHPWDRNEELSSKKIPITRAAEITGLDLPIQLYWFHHWPTLALLPWPDCRGLKAMLEWLGGPRLKPFDSKPILTVGV